MTWSCMAVPTAVMSLRCSLHVSTMWCTGLCDESGKFRGMLLERLNGRVVEKVIMAQDFADVHYVRALLLAVFTALGKAQSWLGRHAFCCCSLGYCLEPCAAHCHACIVCIVKHQQCCCCAMQASQVL